MYVSTPSIQQARALNTCNSLCCNTLNPLNAELNPICHLLALLGVHHFLHVSRIRVNTRDRWMSSEFCNSLHIATMTRLGHQAPLFRRFRKRRRIVFLDSLCHISYVNDYAAVSALSFQH